MFTWLNKQGVQSDTGFVVQFTGRFAAEYREGGKTITLEIENGFSGGVPCVIVAPEAFLKWDGEAELLPAVEQERLLSNFRDSCRFQQLKVLIEEEVPRRS